jgi:hypothetical protein
MRRLWLVLCLLSACATKVAEPPPTPPPAAKYDPARDPVTGQISMQAARAFVAETCRTSDAPEKPIGEPPSVHTVDVGSAKVEQSCGLVFNEVFDRAYIANFAKVVCGLPGEKLSDDCSKRFVEMYMARLAERYTGADWAAVNRKCTAYPLECHDSFALERLLLASHNLSIQAWYYQAVEFARANAYRANQEALAANQLLVQQQRERDADERRRVFEVMAAGLHGLVRARATPPTINCTSNTVGSSTYTNCR